MQRTKQQRETATVPVSTEYDADVLWTVNTGHSLGTYTESLTQTIALPVNQVDSLTLISGNLPGGLRLENNNQLVGTPYEVKRLTEFVFVLRAKKGQKIEDRTLKITIDVSAVQASSGGARLRDRSD